MKISILTKLLPLGLLYISSRLIVAQETYSWNPVRVGGGGAVTSIQAHPKVSNLYFITTDVGTPYRWNNGTQSWEGMFYKNSASTWGNRAAAARLAFDPSDLTGNILYVTTGGPWAVDGTVLKSTDRGDTWSDCKIRLDVKPNSEQSAGQRLAVDPQNSDIVYVTTHSSKSPTDTNGTFKSTKAGAAGSWEKINDLYGSFVQFDASGGDIFGVTKNIYIGCADGVYLSNDGGTSFTLMNGSPVKAVKAAIHSNGTLYVTAASGVFKWNGTVWSNITPPTKGGYSAVAVNPKNDKQVVVSSSSFGPYRFDHYRSNDGGATWTFLKENHDKSEVPWFATAIGQATASFCWDPFSQNTVWFTDFFFAYQTTDIWASPKVTWKSRAVGHEESVPIGTLLCPASGSNVLLSSVADIGGWDHKSLTESPTVGMTTFFPWIGVQTPTGWGGWGNMTGVAVQETNPDFIARVGRVSWDGPGYAGYSTNGGNSYTKWTCPADAAGGRIAVSATGRIMVWVTQQKGAYRSTDLGAHWTAISTLPAGIIAGGNNVFSSGPRFPLAADKVNGSKFYIYYNGKMYVSTDTGSTFHASGSLPSSYPTNSLTVETTPGKEGGIWVGIHAVGLYHSTNSGVSFVKITDVQSAQFVAVGKASPLTPSVPAVYVYGTVNKVDNHLFRSNDNGGTWTDLGQPAIGTTPLAMAADRQVYGRVFFGAGGNGILMGTIRP